MATILHKRKAADPSASDLAVGELAINTSDGGLFLKTSGGTVVEIGATGGTADNTTTFTTSANNSTDETVYPVFVDGTTGPQGAETDSGLTYNPSTGVLTTTQVTGNLTGDVTGNTSGSAGSCTGNAATATALANARTIGGTSFDGTANIAVALAATATALASARNIGGVSFDGTGNIDLPGVNSSGNQNTSGTAAGISGTPNVTVGAVTASSLDISGDVDVDGTLETDALTIDGVTLAETIADTVGAMVGSNTESGIAVTYQDGDNTLDFTVATLNQDTTGTAALAEGLTGTPNVTVGVVTAGSLDISGNADIDGTMEADAYTVDGTTLAEFISDTVGAMVGSNTESGITVAYQDGDNTLDFTVGTLNQDTTGNAATATVLETARNIGGVSFNGSANIDLPGVNASGSQDTSGTAAIATTVTVADESSDTSCNVLYTTAATGNLGPKSGTNLTFNSSSGDLTATLLNGGAGTNLSLDFGSVA